MIPALREQFNQQFTEEKYKAYINELNSIYLGHLEFRVAETPLFVPKDFEQKMLATCEHIIDVIKQPHFKEQSQRAIPPQLYVPGEDDFPHFISFDFGVCKNENEEIEPQLIEMQGFPSLFAWHTIMPEVSRHHFTWPDNLSSYSNDFDKKTNLELLKKIIIADAAIENVVLLEIFPHQQKTRVDFYATEDFLEIKTVCLSDIEQEGKKLFYTNAGRRIKIDRIYNRVIFDELLQQSAAVREKGKIFFEELDATWVPHPNWFYRVSKFTLPFIHHQYVPQTQFLHEAVAIPADLENYVVKPLFSFAGQGVIIDVTREDIEKIKDPENWILQRKVDYASIIKTSDEPAKAEIRMFYFLPPGAARPIAVNNLARLSKGKMIGVRYNQEKTWVGGTFCLFEA